MGSSIIIRTKEDIKYKIDSRDVRNFVGAIVDEKYKDFFMWHERRPPPVIYSRPYANSIDIKVVEDNMDAVAHLFYKLSQQKKVLGFTIENTKTFDYNFIFPKNSIFKKRYKARNAIIAGVNSFMHKEINVFQDAKDIVGLKKYLADSIKDMIVYQTKTYTGVDIDLSDMVLEFAEDDYSFNFMKYKEGVHCPAIKGTIISNYELPNFIGYKTGLGYGQIYEVNKNDL